MNVAVASGKGGTRRRSVSATSHGPMVHARLGIASVSGVDMVLIVTEQAHSRVMGKIPFDRNVNDALMQGRTVMEYGRGPARARRRYDFG